MTNIVVGQSVPVPNAIGENTDYSRTSGRAELLSGIEINQNQVPASGTDYIIPASNYAFQYFKLPNDYQRAGQYAPDITGVQICVNSPPASDFIPTFNYLLQVSGTTISGASIWTTLSSGVINGIHAQGAQIWADIYFSDNVQVTDQILNSLYRIGIQSTNIVGWWYSRGNPYPQGFATDTTGALLPDNSSYMFRLLSYSADNGIDWLGDSYRSVVFNDAANNINTFGINNPNSYWLSQPNPSKFGVECLYFDISDANGNPQVIDRILLNPITQGPVFHIYYSSDGSPVNNPSDWDNKLWTPVPQTFRLTKRDTFTLPTPITANFICIEFSRLQAQYYAPGTYQQPTIYRKFPQWIYNYFMSAQVPITLDPFIANQINVVYNKLQFAFDYYLDDLQTQPNGPEQIFPNQNAIIPQANTTPDQIHPEVLSNINTNLAPYTFSLSSNLTGNDVLTNYIRSALVDFQQPVESLEVPTLANTQVVSVPNRDQIITAEQQPNLYFFIKCRHNYQMSQATFEYNRAYFVGIKEAAFLREDYSIPFDQSLFIETAGDNQNTLVNDFYSINGAWQVINTIT